MQTIGSPSAFGRHGLAVLFLLGLFFLLPGVWSETGITGKDEYWLSLRTPMETLERGGWLTLWLDDQPRLKKPPLLYWAVMLSYKTLGINLMSARIWGVLSGAGLALCAALLSGELFGKRRVLAGVMTLGTMAVAIEGRRAMLDLPLAFFTCMAVYFSLRWGKTGHWRWILLSALSLGLSFLVKGPLGIVFFSAASLSALWAFGKWRFVGARALQVLCALALLLAVCLPWPLAMAHIWPEFIATAQGEMAARQIACIRPGAPLSVLGKALNLSFPWSLAVLAGLAVSLVRGPGHDRRGLRWLAVWFLAALIPCIFMKCFSRYMVPVIPVACVLGAYYLEDGPALLRGVVLKACVCLFGFASVVACMFFLWFGLAPIMASVCLFLVGILLWFTFFPRFISARILKGSMSDRWPGAFSTPVVTVTVAAIMCFLMGGMYPHLGVNAMPQGLEKVVGNSEVAVYNSVQPAMLSMRLKRSITRIRGKRAHVSRALCAFEGYLFMRDEDAKAFETLAENIGLSFEKTGRFRTFYSRSTWLRFARKGTSSEDWKRAFQARSLEGLQSAICYYRVAPCGKA